MHILLTNDDGIDAPGIRALYKAARAMGEVSVVAPAAGQSAMSHAVTHNRPMATYAKQVLDIDGTKLFQGIAVDARPADCVKLALTSLLSRPVDLVLSGMNEGANIGINVLYSGTVGAAMEAAIYGVPAMAVSLHIGDRQRTRWDAASDITRDLLPHLLAGPIESGIMLNVNLPILEDDLTVREPRVCPMSTAASRDRYQAGPAEPQPDHPNGNGETTAAAVAYRFTGGMAFRHVPEGSDVDLIYKRHITLTPVHPDVNAWRHFDRWARHTEGANVATDEASTGHPAQ